MKVDLDLLIDTVGYIAEDLELYHPQYGWIRKDGKLTESGQNFFEDQLPDITIPKTLTGNC